MNLTAWVSIVCNAATPFILYFSWREWRAISRGLDDANTQIRETRHEVRAVDRRLGIVGGTVADIMDDRPRLIKERAGRVYWPSQGAAQ